MRKALGVSLAVVALVILGGCTNGTISAPAAQHATLLDCVADHRANDNSSATLTDAQIRANCKDELARIGRAAFDQKYLD